MAASLRPLMMAWVCFCKDETTISVQGCAAYPAHCSMLLDLNFVWLVL